CQSMILLAILPKKLLKKFKNATDTRGMVKVQLRYCISQKPIPLLYASRLTHLFLPCLPSAQCCNQVTIAEPQRKNRSAEGPVVSFCINSSDVSITQLEGDRRQNLVDELHTRHRQLQASFKNEGTEPDVIRYGIIS
ncbi:hypothetical protein JD844_011753, partial [Phrynosoma platyrhinos]